MPHMTNQLTITAINGRNQAFWNARQKLNEKLMANNDLVETALETIQSELRRRMPIHHQISFDEALDQAARTKNRLSAVQSSEVGNLNAPPSPALTTATEVRRRRGRPKFSGHQRDDWPLILVMLGMRHANPKFSVLAAAKLVAPRALGGGTPASKIDRLRNRYRKVWREINRWRKIPA